MTQPLGNCPGCGADEPFEQVHPGECPDIVGECPEWACATCGAGVFMGGTIFMGTVFMDTVFMDTVFMDTVFMDTVAGAEPVAEQSVRAA